MAKISYSSYEIENATQPVDIKKMLNDHKIKLIEIVRDSWHANISKERVGYIIHDNFW